MLVGRRQVVRHQVLVLAFGGSNPSALARRVYPKGLLRPFLLSYVYEMGEGRTTIIKKADQP